MQQNPTKAVREACEFCGAQHDEMECFRNGVDEDKLFEACYDAANEVKDKTGEYPRPEMLLEQYFGRELKNRELESVMKIAEDALIDAKRDG